MRTTPSSITSNAQSLNRYAYALNNPTTLIDPLGLAGQSPTIQTCGHGLQIPFGQNPKTWCYTHMGIGAGSGPGAFFTNTADEFDLIALVQAAANKGSYYTPCPYGDCGWKTQPIFIPAYSPVALADLLNALLVVPGGITYEPHKGVNPRTTADSNSHVPDWGFLPFDQQACHRQALQQDFAPGVGGFVSSFSVYNVTGNFPITLAVEGVKYGLPALGIALGKPALQAAGAGVAVASGALTATATVMDARARYECGQPIVP